MTTIEKLASDHLRDCELDAEKNPCFVNGMLCTVYDGDPEDEHILGIGRVISENGRTWNEDHRQHLYCIEMNGGGAMMAWQHNMRRMCLDGSTRVAVIKTMRRQGRGSGHENG